MTIMMNTMKRILLIAAAAAALGGDGVLRVRVLVTDTPGRIDLDFREKGGALSVSGRVSTL